MDLDVFLLLSSFPWPWMSECDDLTTMFFVLISAFACRSKPTRLNVQTYPNWRLSRM
jgi:hypothetical protein